MNPHALDVSALPESALDHRSLIWWGNTLLLMIETTMFALLVASYLYLRMNYAEWPPTLVNGPLAISHPIPPLERPTLTLVILLLSMIPAVISDRAALAMNGRAVRLSFALLVALGLGAIGLRFYELPALQFSWDDMREGCSTVPGWYVVAGPEQQTHSSLEVTISCPGRRCFIEISRMWRNAHFIGRAGQT